MSRHRPTDGPSGEAPVEFRPQPGPQEKFLATPADIAIIGGSVFGGKTWALLYDPMRHVQVPGFTFVCFRRVTQEHRNPGGPWDEALNMYPFAGGVPRTDRLEWHFPQSRAHGRFAHLQYDSDCLAWKGAQICGLFFDQLEEFTEYQFWYLYGRNRSSCGVRPYVRASCNPAPDSWLAKFLEWWIDQDTGYAIPERSGKIRWFIRDAGVVHWGDSPSELQARFGARKAKYARSVTFILARLQDNRIGNERDPDYEAKVRAMPYVEQERLLGGERGGNWKVVAAAGNVFPIHCFRTRPVKPAHVEARVRFWDRAAGAEGQEAGDWNVGCLIAAELEGVRRDGTPRWRFVIEDVVRGRWPISRRDQIIKQVAASDALLDPPPEVGTAQGPADTGKESAVNFVRDLAGYPVFTRRETQDKLENASAFAAQAQVGAVDVVPGEHTAAFCSVLHQFPDGPYDDDVDAAAHAFNRLMDRLRIRWSSGRFKTVKR